MVTIANLSDMLTRFFQYLFGTTPNSSYNFVLKLVNMIVSDPLIMAVIALFFTGFVVSIFLRLYHSS